MNKLSNENWISIKKAGLPELELILEDKNFSIYKSQDVLVQNEYGEMYIAFCKKIYTHDGYEIATYWYTNRSTIVSKLVAWMELPEKYKGE